MNKIFGGAALDRSIDASARIAEQSTATENDFIVICLGGRNDAARKLDCRLRAERLQVRRIARATGCRSLSRRARRSNYFNERRCPVGGLATFAAGAASGGTGK
jgi:hypothetical protein